MEVNRDTDSNLSNLEFAEEVNRHWRRAREREQRQKAKRRKRKDGRVVEVIHEGV